MDKQVLTFDQINHLKELGLDTSKGSMCWRRLIRDWKGERKIGKLALTLNKPIIVSNFEAYEDVPTFTLQDILEILPYKIVASYLNIGKKSFSGDILFYVEYSNFGGYAVSHFRNENIIDAAYEMLCWCIENGYLKVN